MMCEIDDARAHDVPWYMRDDERSSGIQGFNFYTIGSTSR